MLGSYFRHSRFFSLFERIYISLFGIPICGLRIRFWRIFPLIEKYFSENLYFLDIGSGRGVFSLETARRFKNSRVVGIDLEFPEKIKHAREVTRKLGIGNCHFLQGDLFQFPFKIRFDMALAVDVIEHIEDDIGFCKMIHSRLNPGGIFIAHVPHLYRNLFGWRRINFDIPGHQRPGYTLEEFQTLMKESGFTLLDSGYTYTSLETLANDLSYLVTQGREKNKTLYALVFPFLLFLSWFGKHHRPAYGSGVYAVGIKQ